MGEKESPRQRRRWSRHDWIRLGIVLWFVACWFIGSARGQLDLDPFFELAWPEAARTEKLTDDVYLARAADESVLGYVGVPEIVLIALFALGIAQRRIRVRKELRSRLRWATLLTGLVVLGFVYNRPFVLAHINMVLIGYWPEWQTHVYWYLLIVGLLLFKAKDEWNLYCYDFCPFGAAQDVLGQIGGAKSRSVRWSNGLLWAKRWLIAAAISLALIYRNPGFSSYEIFGTLFKLEGSSFQFALLAILVFASMFYSRPWCQYLCPLHRHGTEGLFDWCRKQGLTAWRRLRPRPAN
jgi:polyferredoxin